MWVRRLFSRSMRPRRLPHQNVKLKASTERLSRSGSLQRWVGTRAAPFPTPLSPLAALFLRCAPDMFLLTKLNTSCTIVVPASLDSDGVHPGMPFGIIPDSAFGFGGIPIRNESEGK